MTAQYRVIVAKPGLDSHDRGARALASALTQAGFEVIYTGVCLAAETIARAAVDEDVDVICLSMHVGAHMSGARRVIRELERLSALDIPVVCGGIIPIRDHQKLRDLGVAEIVAPRTSMSASIELLTTVCARRRQSASEPTTPKGG